MGDVDVRTPELKAGRVRTACRGGGLPRGRMTRVEEFLPVEARLTPVLGAHTTAPIVISPVFKTPEEVEAGSPLFGYLEHLRARLRELGARRIRRGDAWYWELKPDLKPSEVFTL